PDLWEPSLGHHRHAHGRSRDAHLVWRAVLFRARRRARNRLLADRVVPDAVRPAGGAVQRPPTAAARHAGRNDRDQQRGPRERVTQRAPPPLTERLERAMLILKHATGFGFAP